MYKKWQEKICHSRGIKIFDYDEPKAVIMANRTMFQQKPNMDLESNTENLPQQAARTCTRHA